MAVTSYPAFSLSGALIDILNMQQKSSTPSAPVSGYNYLYFKSDNNLYKQNSSGVETAISDAGLNTSVFVASTIYTYTTAWGGL